MTGYGYATAESETCIIVAEVKTLNSKFLEVSLRLPRDFTDKELEVRNVTGTQLERGKVNLSVERQVKGSAKPKVFINRPVFEAYYRDLESAAEAVNASKEELFKLAMQMPEATISEHAHIPAESSAAGEWPLIQQALNAALEQCNSFRLDEGRVLSGKLQEYIDKIGELLEKVAESDPERMEATRRRLQEKLSELVEEEDIDRNRFEQELIYYIERLDIAEEKVRLRAHLNYFTEALDNGNGKRLGFIAQEIGREINTIGSKVNDAVIQRVVVEMKEELEKIKEQSLNVL